MALKKDKEHWAFLEEIEAPMWVDLALEANSNNQEIDDEWFQTSHPFHQCSSRQLKSAFSHYGERITTSDLDLQGSSSPKLPLSVSRSRGKDYTGKKQKEEKYDFTLNKQHPVKVLSGKSSRVDSGSGEKMKPKSSFINSKGASRPKSSLVCESNLTGNVILSCSKPISTCADPASSSSSTGNKAGDSNTSTITSQSSQQQHRKYMEVSSQPFGPTGRLSVLRISLSKSCVTRQASRVEINNDGRESRGRKSSSGKSSVGSSSSNPTYEIKISTKSARHKEITPDSRNVARMTYAAKNKIKHSSVSKASSTKVEEGSSHSRKVTKINVVKSAHQEAAKSKVHYQTLQARALRPLRVNGQDSSTAAIKPKEKVRASSLTRLAGAGKEKATGRMTLSQKFSGKSITAGGMVGGQKGTKQSVSQKGDRTGLVGSKGKVEVQNEGKILTNMTQKVHFR